jgi:hypothetical protein
MPVIDGVYLKDFTALPGAVADANIIPIAITGNVIAYRTTVSAIVTDARVTSKLLTGLSITGSAILATDTILQAFGKVQNQINGKQGTITLTTTGTSGAATLVGSTLNIPNYADGGITSLAAIGASPNANAATITGTVLNLQPASASFGGVVTTIAQTFAGDKTFTGALSGTSATFSGILITPQVKAATSAGLSINANSGTQVADFGAGGSANITFFGGLSGTSATFSSTVTATAFIPSAATIPTNGMYLSGTNTLDFATNSTNRLSISSTGAASFTNDIKLAYNKSIQGRNIGNTADITLIGVFAGLDKVYIDPSAYGTVLGGALSGTSATFSAENFINTTGHTTNRAYVRIANTGNTSYFGIESSTGGSTITGSAAYATIVGNGSARDLQFATNDAVRLTIASTGAATFASSVTATGFFESSSVKGKDIIAINPLLALDIDVIKYTRKTDQNKDVRYGYSAEQIHSLMPELTDKDVTAVKYLDVHTILIAQLQQEIKELKAKLN